MRQAHKRRRRLTRSYMFTNAFVGLVSFLFFVVGLSYFLPGEIPSATGQTPPYDAIYNASYVIGAALVTVGLFSLATLGPHTSMPLVMLRMALVGVGTATFMSPNSSTIMGSVPKSRLGTASASVATARNIGSAIGLAVAGTVLVAVASAAAGVEGVRADRLPADALLQGIRAGFTVGACVSVLAVLASILRGSRVPLPEPSPGGEPRPAPSSG